MLHFDKYDYYNLPHVTTCPGLPYPDPDCDLSPAKIVLPILFETHSCLLIGFPLFPIALFVVFGAKHGELKKMSFEFEPSGLMTH